MNKYYEVRWHLRGSEDHLYHNLLLVEEVLDTKIPIQ